MLLRSAAPFGCMESRLLPASTMSTSAARNSTESLSLKPPNQRWRVMMSCGREGEVRVQIVARCRSVPRPRRRGGAGCPAWRRRGIAGRGGVDDAAPRVDEQDVPAEERLDARGPADAERLGGEDVEAVDGHVDLIGAEQLRDRAAHGERRQRPAVEALLQRELRVALERVHVRVEDLERAGAELERGQREPEPLAHVAADRRQVGIRASGVRVRRV